MSRRIAPLLAVALAGVTIAACDRASPAPGGEAIEVFGPYRGAEADNFAASLRGFEQETGIEVNYTGSADFVSDLQQRAESGLDAPDIAVVPQPGLIADLVERKVIVPLDDRTIDAIAENYSVSVDDITQGGAGFVAPYRIAPKSLVWYRPDVFEENGWAVPTTFDELVELVDRISTSDSGVATWCFATAAGTATGWAATDWVEDVVLHQAGTDAYDQWTAGTLAWDDPTIRQALTTVDDLVVAAGRSVGGLRRILQGDVTEASAPMFADPPGCAMYKQASFAQSWFPDDVVIGEDVDFFVMPDIDPAETAPMLVGADGAMRTARVRGWAVAALSAVVPVCIGLWDLTARTGRYVDDLADQVALRWRNEDESWGEWTFAEYADKVARVAAGLADLGVSAGSRIVLIGHANHPEVIGTMGQLPDGAVTLVETVADVAKLVPRDPGKLAYITQTTLSVDDTAEIVAALAARFPAIVGPQDRGEGPHALDGQRGHLHAPRLPAALDG